MVRGALLFNPAFLKEPVVPQAGGSFGYVHTENGLMLGASNSKCERVNFDRIYASNNSEDAFTEDAILSSARLVSRGEYVVVFLATASPDCFEASWSASPDSLEMKHLLMTTVRALCNAIDQNEIPSEQPLSLSLTWFATTPTGQCSDILANLRAPQPLPTSPLTPLQPGQAWEVPQSGLMELVIDSLEGFVGMVQAARQKVLSSSQNWEAEVLTLSLVGDDEDQPPFGSIRFVLSCPLAVKQNFERAKRDCALLASLRAASSVLSSPLNTLALPQVEELLTCPTLRLIMPGLVGAVRGLVAARVVGATPGARQPPVPAGKVSFGPVMLNAHHCQLVKAVSELLVAAQTAEQGVMDRLMAALLEGPKKKTKDAPSKPLKRDVSASREVQKRDSSVQRKTEEPTKQTLKKEHSVPRLALRPQEPLPVIPSRQQQQDEEEEEEEEVRHAPTFSAEPHWASTESQSNTPTASKQKVSLLERRAARQANEARPTEAPIHQPRLAGHVVTPVAADPPVELPPVSDAAPTIRPKEDLLDALEGGITDAVTRGQGGVTLPVGVLADVLLWLRRAEEPAPVLSASAAKLQDMEMRLEEATRAAVEARSALARMTASLHDRGKSSMDLRKRIQELETELVEKDKVHEAAVEAVKLKSKDEVRRVELQGQKQLAVLQKQLREADQKLKQEEQRAAEIEKEVPLLKKQLKAAQQATKLAEQRISTAEEETQVLLQRVALREQLSNEKLEALKEEDSNLPPKAPKKRSDSSVKRSTSPPAPKSGTRPTSIPKGPASRRQVSRSPQRAASPVGTVVDPPSARETVNSYLDKHDDVASPSASAINLDIQGLAGMGVFQEDSPPRGRKGFPTSPSTVLDGQGSPLGSPLSQLPPRPQPNPIPGLRQGSAHSRPQEAPTVTPRTSSVRRVSLVSSSLAPQGILRELSPTPEERANLERSVRRVAASPAGLSSSRSLSSSQVLGGSQMLAGLSSYSFSQQPSAQPLHYQQGLHQPSLAGLNRSNSPQGGRVMDFLVQKVPTPRQDLATYDHAHTDVSSQHAAMSPSVHSHGWEGDFDHRSPAGARLLMQ